MPQFNSLAEADAWRAVNAPARKPVRTSEKIGAEVGEKNARVSETTTHSDKTKGEGGKKTEDVTAGGSDEPPRAPEIIDVEAMIVRSGDFDALMLRHAEEAPQIAHGLLRRAMSAGEPGAIAAATKNWHECGKAAADIRERFVTIQKETRVLIHLDDVENVVGTDLQEIRSRLIKLGDRVCGLANPENPAIAKQAIDAGVDELLAKFSLVLDRAAVELRAVQDAAAS